MIRRRRPSVTSAVTPDRVFILFLFYTYVIIVFYDYYYDYRRRRSISKSDHHAVTFIIIIIRALEILSSDANKTIQLVESIPHRNTTTTGAYARNERNKRETIIRLTETRHIDPTRVPNTYVSTVRVNFNRSNGLQQRNRNHFSVRVCATGFR